MSFDLVGIDSASLAGSLEIRLAAARDAGFSHIMISAADIVAHPSGSEAAIRTIRESGLRVTGLECLRDFEGLAGKMHDYKVDVAKSMLSLCSRIGARLLVVQASTSLHADAEQDKIARDLSKLALLALPLGIRIALKGFHWSRTVRSFAEADEILDRANCPNLGIAIDAFDILVTGTPIDDLEIFLPEQIFLVQLSDFMVYEVRSPEEQATTALHFRVFPGEGAHSEQLLAVISKLDELGYRGNYSLDVYNNDYLEMPPDIIAARARLAAEMLGETVLRQTLPVPNMAMLHQIRTS